MRKFYFILTAAAIVLNAGATPLMFSKMKRHHQQPKAVRVAAKSSADIKEQRLNTKADAIWAPMKQIQYSWEEDEWIPSAEFNDTYYSNGRLHVSVAKDLDELASGEASRTTYEYDNAGFETLRLIEITDDEQEGYMNYTRRNRQYDPVVTSLIVSNEEFVWGALIGGADEWKQQGNNYRRIVTRNDAGNVVSTVVETLYMGEYEAVEKLLVEYDDQGVASTIRQEILTYDDNGDEIWETQIEYRDIIWEETDGQIVNENITYDKNRIKSCVVIDEDGENIVNVTYGENGSFQSELTYEFGSIKASLDVLDEYGSNLYTVVETYNDDEESYMMKEVSREMFNIDGLQTESYVAMGEGENVDDISDDDLEVESWMMADVDYDTEHGHTVLYTTKELDPETEEWTNVMKVEFMDYLDVATVNSISDDKSDAVEYYNLQGMRVNGPIPGTVVIRREGAKARKIAL